MYNNKRNLCLELLHHDENIGNKNKKLFSFI